MNLVKLRDMYKGGADDDAIAAAFGITAAEVRKKRSALGLEPASPPPAPVEPVWAARLRELHALQKSTLEIAEALNCTYPTARQRLSELGLPAHRKTTTAVHPNWRPAPPRADRGPLVPPNWHALLKEHGPCSCRELVRVLTTGGYHVNRDALLAQLAEGVRQGTVRRHGSRGRFVTFEATNGRQVRWVR